MPTLDARPPHELLRRWLLALACATVLLFVFSPPLGAFFAWHRAPELGAMVETRRGANVLWQAEHLGAPLPDPLHGAIQWRLLFPALGGLLALPAPVLFGLAEVGGLLALAFVVTVLRRRGVGWLECAAGSVVFGAAAWWLTSVSWLGYFDTWVVLALLLVAFAESRWLVWTACLLAPWVDERFVLGVPVAWLCRLALASPEETAQLKRDALIVAGLLGAFVIVRLGVLSGRSGPQARVGEYLDWLKLGGTPWIRFIFGIWEGLRTGWFFVGAALVLLPRAQGLRLGVAVTIVALVSLATAQDFGRSLMFVAPVVLLGLVLALKNSQRWTRYALRGGAMATLVLPAYLVVSDRVSPVFYLYHELANLDSRPTLLMADAHELQGVRAMEGGDPAEALRELTLAIALAENPTSASKHRGLLAISFGKWDEARKDFTRMTEYEPRNPEGWFLRAQAGLALRDTEAARNDFAQAQAVATGDWAKRPDVVRFAAKLGAAR